MEEQGAAAPAPANKRLEEKYRKKDPKSWDNVTKAMSALEEPNKLEFVKQKYKELYNEVRQLTSNNQQLVKQIAILQKERDHNHAELTKSTVARARIEGVCRELHKQNRQIKEENIAKIKEEEERRKEVSMKFADKLSDINTMMDENKEKSEKLREENLKMTAKLADLYNEFQKREEDISKMSQQLELERQFSQATLKKMELELQAEKEIHDKEQALMKSNLEKSENNCSILLDTVKGLQDHIDVYKNQYEGFESTMSKSAKVFDNFKYEIATMTKQVNTLEEEAQSWKTKFHDSMKALVDLSELKKNQELYLASLEKKNDQLNKLCRQLQVDRSNYLKLLKTNAIEIPPSAVPKEPSGEDTKKSPPKMTKKEKELQLLKNNLQAVQEQLTRLNVEEAEKVETKTEQTSQKGAKKVPKVEAAVIERAPNVADEPKIQEEKKVIEEAPAEQKAQEENKVSQNESVVIEGAPGITDGQKEKEEKKDAPEAVPVGDLQLAASNENSGAKD